MAAMEIQTRTGFRKSEAENDIVVFNFPAGDTVALNRQQEDFYSLAYREGHAYIPIKSIWTV